MRKAKIVLSILLILTMIPIVPGLFSHAEKNYDFTIPNIEKYTSGLLLSESDVYRLADELRTAARNYVLGVDLWEYEIPYNRTATSCVYDLLFDSSEAIHISSLQNFYFPDTNEYARVEFNYFCTKDTYDSHIADCRAAAQEFLKGIDDGLSDLEKALIIHDRLAAYVEYDQDNVDTNTVPDDSFTMYGAMVKRKAVCQGYTHAYTYLLNLVGIQSYTCRSSAMNHAWNIVIIDGKRYHVDVTWDDPIYDIIGRVMHKYFLCSTSDFIPSHNATDYDTSPVDTTYDNAFWNNSNSQFCYLDGEIFYIDNESAQLKKYDRTDLNGSNDTVLHTFSERWRAGSTTSWKGNFSILTNDDNALIFSSNSKVYYYIPVTGQKAELYSPNLSQYSFYNIFGLQAENGVLLCYASGNPTMPSSSGVFFTYRYHIDVPVSVLSGSLEFYYRPDPTYVPEIKLYLYKNTYTDEQILQDIMRGAGCSVTEMPADLTLAGEGACSLDFTFSVRNGNYRICAVSNVPGSVPAFVDCYATGSGTPLGAVHIYMRGDVSGDFNVNITDALMTLRVALNMDRTHANLINVMDMTGDGSITAADASIILQYAAGTRESL